MPGKNGQPVQARAASCKFCGMPIKDAQEAVFDGEDWFCDARCHGQEMGRLSGNVPA